MTSSTGNPMTGATSTSGMSSMGGMEHPANTLSVPPLVDSRVLMQFCRAIQLYADRTGFSDDAGIALAKLRARLDNLRNLAKLCRLAVLGLPNSFSRLLDEMTCVAVDFPDEPLNLPDTREVHEDEPNHRVQFAAVFDLLAGAAFVSKDDPAQMDRLIVGITRAVEHAICYPVAYAAEAASYLGEDSPELAQAQVELVIANATDRLLEGDLRCDPPVPADIRVRLERLAHKWVIANPVTDIFRALTGPYLDHIVKGIQPDDVQTADHVTLQLSPRCVDESGEGDSSGSLLKDVFVLFCPVQLAKIVSVDQTQVQVEVPAGSRTGPIALVREPFLIDVQYLLKLYACEYPIEWGYSLFSSIPMWKWAYPTAFGPPFIEVAQVPQTVKVDAYIRAGPMSAGTQVEVGEPLFIHYRVDPPGSDTAVPVKVSASLGDITQSTLPDMIVYTPRQAGEDTVVLSWGALTKVVRVTVAKVTGRRVSDE